MSLFDNNSLASAEIQDIIEAVSEGKTRESVKEKALSLQGTINALGDVFYSNDVESRRSIIDFIDDAIEELNERKKELDTMTLTSLINGDAVTGFELVEGRMTRKVKDKEKAESVLSKHMEPEAIYENKMIGIPAMEKALKAKGLSVKEVGTLLDEFVSITHGKPVLVKTIEE